MFAGDPRTGTVYNVIMDSRFRSVIDDFFDSCGYRVHRDTEAQWAGITALGEDVPLPRMKLDETIVILVLAAHWQDEVNVGAVEDRAIVVTTLNTLFDRYKDMVQANETNAMSLREVSRYPGKEASQRSLVDVGEFDTEAQDVEVAIRPMIKLISGADALQRIERFVRSQEVGLPVPRAETTHDGTAPHRHGQLAPVRCRGRRADRPHRRVRREPFRQIDHPRHGSGRPDRRQSQCPASQRRGQRQGQEPKRLEAERGRLLPGSAGRRPAQARAGADLYLPRICRSRRESARRSRSAWRSKRAGRRATKPSSAASW